MNLSPTCSFTRLSFFCDESVDTAACGHKYSSNLDISCSLIRIFVTKRDEASCNILFVATDACSKLVYFAPVCGSRAGT